MAKRKCPHAKSVGIVTMQVTKVGSWEGRGPYKLLIYVFGGGAIAIAEGTKRRMMQIQRDAKKTLSGNWSPARCVVGLLLGHVPDSDLPKCKAKTGNGKA